MVKTFYCLISNHRKKSPQPCARIFEIYFVDQGHFFHSKTQIFWGIFEKNIFFPEFNFYFSSRMVEVIFSADFKSTGRTCFSHRKSGDVDSFLFLLINLLFCGRLGNHSSFFVNFWIFCIEFEEFGWWMKTQGEIDQSSLFLKILLQNS